jgi:uncharacterized protein
MGQSNPAVGSVVSLHRYPVKSMMGEELNSSHLTERGLLGDRAFALVDQETGKVASAKNPRKWGQLFDFRASYAGQPRATDKLAPVRISLPDGTLVSSDQDIDETLSETLGRRVKLMRPRLEGPTLEEYWPDIEGLANREIVTDETMPPHTFFDSSPIHLVTTSTIDRLRELYPEGRFEARRFRPNIVVGPTDGRADFVENSWVGKTVAVGEEVRLKVIAGCARCVMTTLPQGDLPADLGILRTAAKHNQTVVGVYASVLRGGGVSRGDSVSID